MQTIETMQVPALEKLGDPCAGCGAPLAADQRYCLNCGQRRTGPRIDYRRYLAPVAERPPPETPQPPATFDASEPPRPERDYAPLAAVGGVAVLGLMLLMGVLIGKGNSSPAPAPTPIVKLGTTAPTGTADGGPKASKAAPAGSKVGSAKRKETAGEQTDTGAKTVAGGLTGGAARQSKGTVQASKGDLEALNNQSGESYEETVKKLPDKIATPGAPPPIDTSKAPGGGSGALTIE